MPVTPPPTSARGINAAITWRWRRWGSRVLGPFHALSVVGRGRPRLGGAISPVRATRDPLRRVPVASGPPLWSCRAPRDTAWAMSQESVGIAQQLFGEFQVGVERDEPGSWFESDRRAHRSRDSSQTGQRARCKSGTHTHPTSPTSTAACVDPVRCSMNTHAQLGLIVAQRWTSLWHNTHRATRTFRRHALGQRCEARSWRPVTPVAAGWSPVAHVSLADRRHGQVPPSGTSEKGICRRSSERPARRAGEQSPELR